MDMNTVLQLAKLAGVSIRGHYDESGATPQELQRFATHVVAYQTSMNATPAADKQVTVRVKCEDCGHEQEVRGISSGGRCYFGSGYDFCDMCEGKPHPIE
jgi:hypothetical protein